MTSALFGLLLAGGASSRMQRDKAALSYGGRPQLQRAFALLQEVCAASFVSVRPDQAEDPLRSAYPRIVDRQPGLGPIAGISAALQEHPKAAWLVLACDLPFLAQDTLTHLIEHRDPSRLATAYRSSHDGLPEPLCAIWEPASREPLLVYLTTGKQCPRKFLINADVHLLDLPNVDALDNVNTPAEFAEASVAIGGASGEQSGPRATATRKAIRIQYYAILREQAGRSEETIDTSAATAADLYDELSRRHPFQLKAQQLKVALNSEFSEWHTPLKHGDTVVFIPPVAGG
jgi:molybdopterin converting factor subunit 1